MRREREVAIGKSLELFGRSFARPVVQVAASVGELATNGWRDYFHSRDLAEVRRPWGSEWWR